MVYGAFCAFKPIYAQYPATIGSLHHIKRRDGKSDRKREGDDASELLHDFENCRETVSYFLNFLLVCLFVSFKILFI